MKAESYREELAALAEGLEVNRYYDSWRLMVMLWRAIWQNSSFDWAKYRMDAWGMFTERVVGAARTTSDLDAFLSRVARFLQLRAIGANSDDRDELTRLLALPSADRQAILRQIRVDAPILVALVRRWRDISKEARTLFDAAQETGGTE